MENDNRFEVEAWQAIPIEETLESAKSEYTATDLGTALPRRQAGGRWVVTTGIRPVDLYVYLKARFGEPNGLTMIGKNWDDSDNLIPWHYTLRCSAGQIDILCFTFRIDVWQPFSRDITDVPLFLAAIKHDFARCAQSMTKVRKGLENWQVFLNPYVRLKKMIEDQLTELEALELDKVEEPGHPQSAESAEHFQKKFTEAAKKFSRAAQICLSVRMLAPVWAESFVNLILLD